MSDNIYSFLDFVEQRNNKCSEAPEDTLAGLLHQSDIKGFLRVCEILRHIGDSATVIITSDTINIQCAQSALENEIYDDPRGSIFKSAGAHQDVEIEFEYDFSENESILSSSEYDRYIKETTKTIEFAIEELCAWGIGDEENIKNPEEY